MFFWSRPYRAVSDNERERRVCPSWILTVIYTFSIASESISFSLLSSLIFSHIGKGLSETCWNPESKRKQNRSEVGIFWKFLAFLILLAFASAYIQRIGNSYSRWSQTCPVAASTLGWCQYGLILTYGYLQTETGARQQSGWLTFSVLSEVFPWRVVRSFKMAAEFRRQPDRSRDRRQQLSRRLLPRAITCLLSRQLHARLKLRRPVFCCKRQQTSANVSTDRTVGWPDSLQTTCAHARINVCVSVYVCVAVYLFACIGCKCVKKSSDMNAHMYIYV